MPKTVNTDAQIRLQSLLKAARERAGLTQVDLAARIGRPQSFIAKYERGERRLDVVEFVVVANAIGADPRKMLGQLLRTGVPARI
jgi:transcriptional regulator with XRE-family HTH domain